MKRAAVWREPSREERRPWYVDVCDAEDYDALAGIPNRCAPFMAELGPGYPTHAEAMTAALEAVGLTENTKKETNR